jgi:hypothetical protein
MCSKTNFDGYYFRKFKLPENTSTIYPVVPGSPPMSLENTSEKAAWYFLNHLNLSACILGCIAWEDFCNLDDQDELNADMGRRGDEYDAALKEARKNCREGCTHYECYCNMNLVPFPAPAERPKWKWVREDGK